MTRLMPSLSRLYPGAILLGILIGLVLIKGSIVVWSAEVSNPPNTTVANITGTASDDILINCGTVTGNISGLADKDYIYNGGLVQGDILGGDGNDSIWNEGEVLNDINGGAGKDKIKNFGIVRGNILGGTEDDFIVNRGKIYGGIDGEAGNDRIVNYNKVNGDISGGTGDDSLANFEIVSGNIAGGAGTDEVFQGGRVSGNIMGDNGAGNLAGTDDLLIFGPNSWTGGNVGEFEYIHKEPGGSAYIGGNLDLSETEQLTIELDSLDYPSFKVKGTVTLGGSTFLRVVIHKGYYRSGIYELFTTGAIAGWRRETLVMAQPSLTLDFELLNAQVYVYRTNYSYFAQWFPRNEFALANYLDTVSDIATGDMQNLIANLDFCGDEGDLLIAMEQLLPRNNLAIPSMGLNVTRQFNTTTSARMDDARQALPAVAMVMDPDDPATWPLLASAADPGTTGPILSTSATSRSDDRFGFGVKAAGHWSEGLEAEGITGYDALSWSVATFADYRFTDYFLAGLTFGYGESYLQFHDSGDSEADLTSWMAGAYASLYGESWFIEGLAAASVHLYDQERSIKFQDIDRTAEADYKGYDLTVRLSAGFDVEIDDFTISPLAVGEYVYQTINPYKEQGAEAADIYLEGQSVHSLRAGGGLKLSYDFGTSWGTLTPEASVLYLYELFGVPTKTRAILAGHRTDSFQLLSPDLARDSWLFTLGLTADFESGSKLYVKYMTEFNDTYYTHSFITGFLLAF